MDNLKKWLKKSLPILVSVVLLITPIILLKSYISNFPVTKIVQYTEFMQMIKNKQINNVSIDLNKSTFEFADKKGNIYETDNPKDKDFKKNLLEDNVKVTEVSSTNFVDIITKLFNIAFLSLCIYSIFKFTNKTDKTKKTSTTVLNIPKVKFSQIAGNSEVKKEVSVLVDFLKNPDKYIKSGAKMPKGVIFYGPPGTGKTLTAKAIAGEAGVPFFNISGSDFIEMYVGLGAKRVRELFAQARKKAPCIIFIDEFDAIGGKRGTSSQSEYDQTVNALLTEMDGFQGNEGILVMVATNRLDTLDEALIRAGRFDKHVMIPLPATSSERLEILKLYAKNKKLADDVSLEEIAKQTIGFSGSDIETLLNEATIISVTENKEAVDKECIDQAFFQKLLKGHQKKDIDRQDDETRLTAWHEAGHALTTKLLTDYDVPKVTIVQSTSGAGGVTFFTPKKMGLMSKTELCNNVKKCYGGRVAEFLLLGNKDSITTGAYNDIQQATQYIKNMIENYGMDENIGLLNLSILDVNNSDILKEATKLSNKLYEETVSLLTDNKDTLEKIANALIERETLSGDELDKIINGESLLDIKKEAVDESSKNFIPIDREFYKR